MRRNADYGNGVVSVPTGSLRGQQRLGPAELKAKLLELFRSPGYRPPLLPVVAVELLALVRQPRTEVREVVALLRQDSLLAARLLAIAQSPIYATSAVRTLEDAIVRLGTNRVADLFLRASLDLRVFRAPGYDEPMNQLRRHSAVTAELALKVCRAGIGMEDYAFVCGLLHDIGIAASILALSELDPKPPLDKVWPSIEPIHEACSEIIARIWKLAPDIATVLSLHHRLSLDGHAHPIAAAVAIADRLADEAGCGFLAETDPELFQSAQRVLGIDAKTLDRLRADAHALAAAIH
jgi:HD-like signal output (HDOD) protein